MAEPNDFLLEPEEIEPERPVLGKPARIFSSGLAPTAEVPPSPRKKETPPCHVPCATCGNPVLLGQTRAGLTLALDVRQATYTVVWGSGEAHPTLEHSRGYPVHQCPGTPREASL